MAAGRAITSGDRSPTVVGPLVTQHRPARPALSCRIKITVKCASCGRSLSDGAMCPPDCDLARQVSSTYQEDGHESRSDIDASSIILPIPACSVSAWMSSAILPIPVWALSILAIPACSAR